MKCKCGNETWEVLSGTEMQLSPGQHVDLKDKPIALICETCDREYHADVRIIVGAQYCGPATDDF